MTTLQQKRQIITEKANLLIGAIPESILTEIIHGIDNKYPELWSDTNDIVLFKTVKDCIQWINDTDEARIILINELIDILTDETIQDDQLRQKVNNMVLPEANTITVSNGMVVYGYQ